MTDEQPQDDDEWLKIMLGPKDAEEQHQRRLDLIAEVIKLREERETLQERVSLMSQAGMIHAEASEKMRQALGSLIDVVDELCMGLAVGQTPDREWGEMVSASLSEHRKTLGFTGPQ